MALIKCPECGKEVSDKAKTCPNCGCPIDRFLDKRDFQTYTLIAYLLFLFFLVFHDISPYWLCNQFHIIGINICFFYCIVKVRRKTMYTISYTTYCIWNYDCYTINRIACCIKHIDTYFKAL